MSRRHVWRAAILTIAPVVALAGAASANHIRGSFADETRSPGSAVTQQYPMTTSQPALPPVVVQPGQQVIVAPAQPGTVVAAPGTVVTAPGTVVTAPATVAQPSVMQAPQMVQAEDLQANEVRAQTIYANKIEAPDVQGTIHQTGTVKLDSSVRDLTTPTVNASIVYADTIKAHRVVADHIFVRDLQRR